MAAESNMLDYSKLPPSRRWRRRVAVLCVAALLIVGYRYRWMASEAVTRVQIVMLERSCARYQAKPDMIVYEERPDAAKGLLALPGYVRMQRESDPDSPLAGYIVPAWDRLGRTRAYQSNRQTLTPRATLFCHERTTTAGQRRLVVVDFCPERRDLNGPEQLGFHLYIFSTGSVWSPPECIRHLYGEIDVFVDVGRASKNLRFLAGQADSADPARFTIPYEINGQRAVIGGALVDDATPKADDCTTITLECPGSPRR